MINRRAPSSLIEGQLELELLSSRPIQSYTWSFLQQSPLLVVTTDCCNLCTVLIGADCDGSATSAKASFVTLLCSLIITIPGLLVIAFYGSFADRYGLKKTLLVPVIGNLIFCGCILLAMWQTFSPFYVNLLLLGSLCSGLSGIPYILFNSTRFYM